MCSGTTAGIFSALPNDNPKNATTLRIIVSMEQCGHLWPGNNGTRGMRGWDRGHGARHRKRGSGAFFGGKGTDTYFPIFVSTVCGLCGLTENGKIGVCPLPKRPQCGAPWAAGAQACIKCG